VDGASARLGLASRPDRDYFSADLRKVPTVLYPADGPDKMLKRLIAFATVLVSLILLGMVAGR
jgi:hypothetical protein